MINLKNFEAWFITGSQHLYGEKTLKKVEEHSRQLVKGISSSKEIPVKVIFKSVVTTPDSIYRICLEANNSPKCIGLLIWMHTFSPAKMWISGLKVLQKPLVHLHTQFNRDIPWDTIDMDFMNLNQSAHGDREFGYICTRMNKPRKVIVGYWQDKSVLEKLNIWIRAACAKLDMFGAKFARFGDNMREVAVTEGDKVEAQIQFGYSVNGYGVGELVKFVNASTNSQINRLIAKYETEYTLAPSLKKNGEKRK
ncbi:MAG: L-arabinose isomerase, partial [Ignavibacteriaceae bacterium]